MKPLPPSLRRRLAAWFGRLPLAAGAVPSLLIAIAGIGVATVVLLPTARLLGEGDTALLYMPVIVGIAAVGGVRAGLISSVLGFFVAKYFFVPTYYSLHVQDPRDYVSLVVFVLVGLGMGVQTTRMQKRQEEVAARERDTALLYHLGGVLAVESSLDRLCERVVTEVGSLAEHRGATLYLRDGRGHTVLQASAGLALSALQQQAVEAGMTASADDVRLLADGVLMLRLRADPDEGVLCVLRSDPGPLDVQLMRLHASIARLVTVHITRQRLEQVAAQAAGLREADRLRSNLVQSVSHELKTPLAIVTAVVTNLLEADQTLPAEEVRKELAVAADGLTRLNSSISDLLALSRLESGDWMPRREWYDVDEVFESVRRALPVLAQRRLQFDVDPAMPMVWVDFVQWVRMLGHVVENAISYSPADSAVRVRAFPSADAVVTTVEDHGPGVTVSERTRIFEKFFRGCASVAAPGGTGLGLAISQDIVRFHEGSIRVEGRDEGGARFVIVLPRGEPPLARDPSDSSEGLAQDASATKT